MPESSLLIRALATKAPKESKGVRLTEGLAFAEMEVPPFRLKQPNLQKGRAKNPFDPVCSTEDEFLTTLSVETYLPSLGLETNFDRR
jgi:hypothetical protein